MTAASAYDVVLAIETHFQAAAADARQVLRVRPREGFNQTVERAALRIMPEAAEAMRERDFFGNPCDHLAFAAGHETLRVEMQARVLVAEPPPRGNFSLSLAALRSAAAACRDVAPLSPIHFLGPSRMVDFADPALAACPMRELDESGDAFDAVLGLARAIKADFRYSPGATDVDTPLAAVIESRAGVCQDFTHLAIAILRRRGIPAAYASGLLRTDPPPGQPRRPHADAMHAWLLAWLGAEAGWVGFDPTNGVAVGRDHILVAMGRDYGDVAPVDGVLVTSGSQSARHTVDVRPAATP